MSYSGKVICNKSRNNLNIEKYKDYLDKALGYYYDKFTFLKFFQKEPKSRYYSFKYVIQYINDNKLKNVLELGTSRSFVDGRFEGCNLSSNEYWEPKNPEKWDWSAGLFTRVFAEEFKGEINLDTLDSNKEHLRRSKIILENYTKNVNFIRSTSEDYLKTTNKKYDVIYLDTGDMTPVEDTALLQLIESNIIIERNLLNKNGLLIIDDVRNPTPKIAGETNNLGKAKYSIPYLLENDFEIIMDEYQVILIKK
jgi:hypothetical protein